MPNFVIFRLEAPIAAFGELAAGERRVTAARPSHSAIAGLVAASLGVERDDARAEQIAGAFLMALRVDGVGTPLADFHTAQTPPRIRGASYATRRDELSIKENLGTIVSRRDYWTDVAFTVLLMPHEDMLDAALLAEALNRPVFPPYAGRRSCPLGAPVGASVVAAPTIVEALAVFDAALDVRYARAGLAHPPKGRTAACDSAFSDELRAGIVQPRLEERRDVALTRVGNRAFGIRNEAVGTISMIQTEGAAK